MHSLDLATPASRRPPRAGGGRAEASSARAAHAARHVGAVPFVSQLHNHLVRARRAAPRPRAGAPGCGRGLTRVLRRRCAPRSSRAAPRSTPRCSTCCSAAPSSRSRPQRRRRRRRRCGRTSRHRRRVVLKLGRERGARFGLGRREGRTDTQRHTQRLLRKKNSTLAHIKVQVSVLHTHTVHTHTHTHTLTHLQETRPSHD